MSYDYRAKKIVAILNGELSGGLALNALGHLAFSAGRYSDQEMMGKSEIIDKDGNKHRGISKYPFIVLKANKEEIKDIVIRAREGKIFFVDYPKEMFDTVADEELVNAPAIAKEPEIEYHGVILLGESEKLKKLTGNLKLWK